MSDGHYHEPTDPRGVRAEALERLLIEQAEAFSWHGDETFGDSRASLEGHRLHPGGLEYAARPHAAVATLRK